jgi:hypothetical protein
MQVTGRIRWADKFALKPAEQPAGEFKAEPGAAVTALN